MPGHACRFTAQALANTLWGLATLRTAPPEPWLRSFMQQVAAQLPQCTPAGLGQLFFGLGVLGHKPSDEAVTAMLQQVGRLCCVP
jgi:hypothetical protein